MEMLLRAGLAADDAATAQSVRGEAPSLAMVAAVGITKHISTTALACTWGRYCDP